MTGAWQGGLGEKCGPVVPAANAAALHFLDAHRARETARAPRMVLGEDAAWRPESVFARASGNCDGSRKDFTNAIREGSVKYAPPVAAASLIFSLVLASPVSARDRQGRFTVDPPATRPPTPVVGTAPDGQAVPPQTKPMTVEEMHKLHQNSAAYIAMLEDPARDAYQKPHEVLMALELKDGERIADIGAGAGYFSLRFANHVGDRGVVYAVDISPEMIAHLEARTKQAGVRNVRTILAKPDDPLLPGPVDRFFICDTWHHIGDHARYLDLMRKTLRPGGQVVIVDYRKDAPDGPPPEMRIARDDVVREFEQHGFRLAREHTFLPYQYFLVFTPEVPGRK